MLNALLPRYQVTLDRELRVPIGAGILALAFVGPKSPWAFIGLVPIVTGLIGSCPLHTLLGLRTCPLKN